MKKSIIKIFTMIIGFVLVMACDPMKDVYEELDKNPSSISSDLDFTLEDDDYELSGIESAEKYKSFSTIDDAKEGIPNILDSKYPQLGAPSSALVRYDLYQGSVKYPYDDYEADYGDEVTNPIPVYEVTQDDYDTVLGDGNYGSFGSLSEIRDFLNYKYPDAWDNSGAILTYMYYAGSTTEKTETFSKHYEVWYDQRVLSAEDGDYDYMLRTGKDYFSNQDEAEEKIPVWLNPQFPYAKAGDRYLVQYLWRDYDDDRKEKEQLVLSSFNGEGWEMIGSIIEAQLQLGHNGSNWVPDNTIKYSMTSADYTAVSEAFASSNPEGSESMAKYGNYDTGFWTAEEITESIGGVLKSNFPGSEEGQKYLVFYSVYTGASQTWTEHLILSGGEYVPVGSE